MAGDFLLIILTEGEKCLSLRVLFNSGFVFISVETNFQRYQGYYGESKTDPKRA
jgi:hypothetical protein